MKVFLIEFCAFLFISLLFLGLISYNSGSISYTFDEYNDLAIVHCLVETGNPFSCVEDMAQARLPFYIHTIAEKLFGPSVHYWISILFAFLSLLLTYFFTKRHFGKKTAFIASLLFISSIPVLASARMLITHSNIILLHFSLWSFFCFYEFVQKPKASYFILTAIFWGVSLACSVLAAFNAFFFFIYYLLEIRKLRFKFYYLLFPFLGLAIFFGINIIYFDSDNLYYFWQGVINGYDYPHWNYFNLGRMDAPFWFSFLLFSIKMNPLLTLAFFAFPFLYRRFEQKASQRFLLSIYLFVLLNLVLKSMVFHYDTPHHQVYYYPLVFVLLACEIRLIYDLALKKIWKRLILVAGISLLCLQGYDIYRFFPNYLFYGAQYGSAFIGEFYGPAVMHGQDLDEIRAKVWSDVVPSDPEATFAYYEKGVFYFRGKRFVNFSHLKAENTVDYILIDYVSAHHLNYESQEAFRTFAYTQCEEYYTYYFPTKKWAYQIRRCTN